MAGRISESEVDRVAFGHRLREARLTVIEKGRPKYPTRRLLANDIGAHEQSIYRWEKGRTFPEAEDLAKLCRVLGVSQEYLLYATVEDSATQSAAMTDPQLVRLLARPEVQKLPQKKRAALLALIADEKIDETDVIAALRLIFR